MLMTHHTIEISLLDAHPRNYRKHPEEQIKRLMASLIRYEGQVRSIVVKRGIGGRYTILAGHGLTEAASRAGIKELNVILSLIPFPKPTLMPIF